MCEEEGLWWKVIRFSWSVYVGMQFILAGAPITNNGCPGRQKFKKIHFLKTFVINVEG